MEFLTQMGTYGDLVHFRLGTRDAYLINNPEYLNEIFIKQADRVGRHPVTSRAATKFIGEALPMLDGERHRRERSQILQAFNQRRMPSYAAVMRDETLRMLAHWRGKRQVALDYEMQAVSLRIACRTLFGSDARGQTERIIHAMADFQKVMAFETRNVMPIPDWLPIPHKLRMRRTIETLRGFVGELVASRRDSGDDTEDLLSMLLAAADAESACALTNQQIRDHAIFLVIAGHETTSNLLAWVPYLLDRHPSVHSRVLQELEPLQGRPPDFSDLPRMAYLEQVCKETLRLYPSAWMLIKTATAELDLGPYKIRPGDSLFLSPFVTHRDPRFHPDPTQFRPERFAHDAEQRLPRFAFFPFGGGATACIGQQFAMATAKIVLGTILQRYRLECASAQEVKPAGLVTLRPRQELQMYIHERT